MSWSEKINSAVNFINCSKFSNGQYVMIANWQATGTYAGIQISSNFGTSFTQISPSGTSSYPWSQPLINSNGKYLVACTGVTDGFPNGFIYASSSSGVNWTLAYTIGVACNGLASDSTGQYVICGTGSGILRSTNYGFSWTYTGLNSGTINTVTSDSTGQYLVGAGHGNGTYYSMNYGSSWSTSTGSNSNWAFGIASDTTGQFVVYSTIYAGGIFRSINYGQSFTQVYSGNFGYRMVSSDLTGTNLIVSVYEGASNGVIISNNSGSSWTAVSNIANSEGITQTAINSNGTNLYASGYNGMWSYISDSTPLAPPITTAIITPSATQTVSYPATTSVTVTATSNSPGAFTYSLQSGFHTGTSINSATGVVTIGGPGTINVLVTQAASGNFTAVTTPVAAGTVNVWTSPIINQVTNWTLLPSSLPSNLNYISVVSNSSGNYLLANVKSNASYGVYASSSYGINWSPTSAPVNKPYVALALNSTGQYAIAAANGEYIYLSSSYGVNWSQTTAPLAPWYSTSVNSTGQYMVGAATGVGTYVSSNYGISWQIPVTFSNTLDINTFLNQSYQSWTQSSPSSVGSATWAALAISISSTGTAIFGAAVSATAITGLYYSTNYGQYWIQSNITTTVGWLTAASSDGKYAVASQWYGGSIYYSSNYGQTWLVSVNGNVNPGWGIAMSGNGQYAIAGSFLYSDNYGVNWYSATGGSSYTSPCAMSYTGQYALASTTPNNVGTLVFSSTYGKTWTSTVFTTGGTISGYWFKPTFATGPNSPYAIASSTGLYYSTNYGYSWTLSNLTSQGSHAITMSSTGQYALAGIINSYDMCISTNYGVYWQKFNNAQYYFGSNSQALAVTDDFKYLLYGGFNGIYYQTLPGIDGECAISSSGQYAITTAPNTVYVSSNYGNSWPTSSITGSILGATVNSIGDYMAVSVDGIGIYISSNYGNSWVKSNADNGSWRMIKMSSSGNIVYGLKNDGTNTNNYYIQSSSSYGMNWTATTSPFLKWYSITMDDAATRIFAASVLNGVYLLVQVKISIITPAANQNINLSIVTNSVTVTATSSSPGVLSYYLSTSFGTTTANASINTSTGTISINGPGTINVYVTQSAYGTSYAAVTTPTLAGTISVLAVPTIRPAATQTILFS